MQKVPTKKMLRSLAVFLLGIAGSCSPAIAADNLFFQALGAAKVGTFDIGAGGSQRVSDSSTDIWYFTSADCSSFTQTCDSTAAGDGFTFNPNSQVNVSAEGVYTLLGSGSGSDCTPGNIHSVAVIPLDIETGYIFTQTLDPPAVCFSNVTCSGSTCTGTSTPSATLR